MDPSESESEVNLNWCKEVRGSHQVSMALYRVDFKMTLSNVKEPLCINAYEKSKKKPSPLQTKSLVLRV
ncbi:hypothetical protein QR98_0041240 [Sarcoptes scabiei]|uniref:Uncharacterized protein n=1 Tax=Sarcoptes scabiei TaxID=52283 RepID=A0A132A3U7_SARSC|nr:hypothetical protein QR98_0041240 [Sarcoptes scabiei]